CALARRVRDALGDAVREDALGEPLGRAMRYMEHPPLTDRRRQPRHHLLRDMLGFACVDLVGTDLAADVVQDIAEVERVESTEPEVYAKLQARLARRRIDPVVLLKEQDPEAAEAGVLDREPILGFIHPEAARSTRPRCEENVVVNDLLAAEPRRLEGLQ